MSNELNLRLNFKKAMPMMPVPLGFAEVRGYQTWKNYPHVIEVCAVKINFMLPFTLKVND